MTAESLTVSTFLPPSATDHLEVVPNVETSVEGSDHLANASATPTSFTALRIFAEMFEDVQKARIACQLRMIQGVKLGVVDPEIVAIQLESLMTTEKVAKKHLLWEYRRAVPSEIRQWQDNTVGIGSHLLARLIGTIGHPVHAQPHHWEGEGSTRTLVADPPYDRSVAQLWSYCGHGDATRKRRVGMSWEDGAKLGNPRAKKILHLLAEACMKQTTSPYRPIYEKARLEYESREGWTKAHQHAAALRLMGKEILRDLWTISR